MPSQDQWDERFWRGDHAQLEPDPFIASCMEYWDLLPSPADERTAVDLASGAGRHAIYVASEGFKTTAIDFSEAGLELAQARAAERGLSLTTQQVDLESSDLNLGDARFDVITVFNFLHRPLFDTLKTTLKPGGLVVYKTYTIDQLALPDGPKNPAFVLQPNELLERFAGYRVLRYQERIQGEGTAAIVAQKP
jgi:tellurite methyltransferase